MHAPNYLSKVVNLVDFFESSMLPTRCYVFLTLSEYMICFREEVIRDNKGTELRVFFHDLYIRQMSLVLCEGVFAYPSEHILCAHTCVAEARG